MNAISDPDTSPPIIASNVNELKSAIRNAAGGEVILLAPGDYDALALSNLHFDVPVTIRSSDNDNRAVFSNQIYLNNVSGLNFVQTDVGGGAPLAMWQSRVMLRDSENIQFTDLAVAGMVRDASIDQDDPALSAAELLLGAPHEYGVSINGSQNISLNQLDITGVITGTTIASSENVWIADSEFHHLRSDGIQIRNSSSLIIERNYFHDFNPWINPEGGGSDHPDAIQYYNRFGTDRIDQMIIRDNAIIMTNKKEVQGIFGHAGYGGYSDPTQAPFTNFTISGNIIQSNHVNAIYLGDIHGAEVTGNTLVPAGQDNSMTAGGWNPAVKIVDTGGYDVIGDLNIHHNALVLTWEAGLNPGGYSEAMKDQLNITIADNEILDHSRGLADFWQNITLPRPDEFSSFDEWRDYALEVIRARGEAPAPPAGQTLTGGEGDDIITGGDGDDTLLGSSGDDSYTGGEGADMLVINHGGAGYWFTDLNFSEGDSIHFAPGDGPSALVSSFRDLQNFASRDDVRPVLSDENDVFLIIGEGAAATQLKLNFAGENWSSYDLSPSLSDYFSTTSGGETLRLDVLGDHGLSDGFLSGVASAQSGARVSVTGNQISYEAPEAQGPVFLRDVITYEISDGAGGAGRGQVFVTVSDPGALTRAGSAGIDLIMGQNGDDIIESYDGNDRIFTLAGNDWIDAGAGNDMIIDGAGSDTMTGGDDADIFQFRHGYSEAGDHDLITDLSFSEGDRISLAGFAQNTFSSDCGATTASGRDCLISSMDELMALRALAGVTLTREGAGLARLTFKTEGGGAAFADLYVGEEDIAAFEDMWQVL